MNSAGPNLELGAGECARDDVTGGADGAIGCAATVTSNRQSL